MSTMGKRTKIEGDILRILQLSDLHFSSEADATALGSRHDHGMAARIQKAVLELNPDLVFVTGDLTDDGSREQLLRVKDYLFGTYAVSGTQRIGLALDPPKVRILPGNHDAFNLNKTIGSWSDRVQTSLENFYSVFTDVGVACSPNSCAYEWIELNSWNAYVAYADSCFVGDPHWPHSSPKGKKFFETTAKGKIAEAQAEKLLRWSDEGRRGQLPIGIDNCRDLIQPTHFMQSLKMLVMHHYVFEPPHKRDDPLANFMDRTRVFRNIALADFDTLWCGHKHISDFSPHTYGHHLGDEGRLRLAFNCLRRNAGMPSLPLRQLPISKKQTNRYFGFLLGSMVRARALSKKQTKPAIEQGKFDAEFAMLAKAIDDPRTFEKNVRAIISETRSSGSLCFDFDECMELAKRYEEEFSHDDRRAISARVKQVGVKMSKNLSRRPFLQALAYSTTKRATLSDQTRGFYLHELQLTSNKYHLSVRPFEWREVERDYVEIESHVYQIPLSRGFEVA